MVPRLGADRAGRPQAEAAASAAAPSTSPGLEQFAVNWATDSDTEEVVELLAR